METVDIFSICRICLDFLDNGQVAYNLFIVPGLAKKLCMWTALQIKPQDGFPKNICEICYRRLNDMVDFQKLCMNSVQRFQKLILNNKNHLNNPIEKILMTSTVLPAPISTTKPIVTPTTTVMLMDSLNCLETPANIDILDQKIEREEKQHNFEDQHLNDDNNEQMLGNEIHGEGGLGKDDNNYEYDGRENFDPLLVSNLRMEMINNEEDVFKMLENVDKDIRDGHINDHNENYHEFVDKHNDDGDIDNNIQYNKSNETDNQKCNNQYYRKERSILSKLFAEAEKMGCINEAEDEDDDGDGDEDSDEEENHNDEDEIEGDKERDEIEYDLHVQHETVKRNMKKAKEIINNEQSDDDFDQDDTPLAKRLHKIPLPKFSNHLRQREGQNHINCKDNNNDYSEDRTDTDSSVTNVNEDRITHFELRTRHKNLTKATADKITNNRARISKMRSHKSFEDQRRKRIPVSERHLHRIIDCHICHQKFKKTRNYEEHMKHHNDKLPFQCGVENCKRGFTTAYGLRLHVEHCHSETVEKMPCTVEGCNQSFTRRRILNWHLKRIHKVAKEDVPKNYPCTECDKIFKCPMALKKHMYKHDGKELPFPCNICGKRFVINSALKDHLMRHAGIKNYVCPYCGVGKTTRQEWNTHIATHSQEKKFKCHLCPHASHNKNNLRMHIRVVHEKIKDYACQYCGKTFGKSNACKMHEMTHTGEKRCECKVCGKRFLYPKGLTKHLKTHEKRVLRAIEIYRKRQAEAGDISPEQAADLPSLPDPTDHTQESHQKVADEILKVCADSVNAIPRDPRRVQRVDITELAGTAINPIPQVAVPSWSPQINFMMKEGKYTCPDCGQGFNGSGNLRRHHKIVHQGVKDFACRFCHKRFAKAQTLKHHEMTHTGEKPHACNLCEARFIQVVALKRHMKVHEKLPNLVPVTVIQAKEELALQERESQEAKRKAELEREAVAEKARKQLEAITRQEEELQRRQREAFENLPRAIPKERLPPGSDITIATNLLPSDLEKFTTCLKVERKVDSIPLE